MFKINENKSIYVTRGDYCDIPVVGMVNGEAYQFQVGDVVRFKATRKKDCNSVVIQRDILVEAESDAVTFHLTGDDTRIGDVISKPTDFWYEVELNPDSTDPQTIIGYDESGAKILKLFPEGADVNAEDIEVVGKKTLQNLVDDALRQAKESVNEAVETHKQDKANPHGVTAEQVGAAPAGYGLGNRSQGTTGVECSTKEQLDALTYNGFWAYRNPNVALVEGNASAKYVKGITLAYNSSCVTQIGFLNSSGKCIVREKYTSWGAWKDWDFTGSDVQVSEILGEDVSEQRGYGLSAEVRSDYLTLKVKYSDNERTSTLDSVAFGGKTYRDIFVTGNLFQDGGFENGIPTFLGNAPTKTYGNPVVQSEVKETGNYALYLTGDGVASDYFEYPKYALNAGSVHYNYIRARIDSYTQGQMAMQCTSNPIAPFFSTNGKWVTASRWFQPGANVNNRAMYLGCMKKDGVLPILDGYLDNIGVLDLTAIFGAGNEPSKGQMDYLLEQYIHILRGDELTKERTYVLPLSYGGEFSDEECIIAFMRAANDKANALGMTKSYFRTPSGMVVDGNANVCTAGDGMKLLMAAFGHERIAEILMRKEYQSYSGGETERGFKTSNIFLQGNSPAKMAEKGFYCFGGKGGSLSGSISGQGNYGILNQAVLCGYEGKQVAVCFMGEHYYDASGKKKESYPLLIDIMKKVSGSTDETPTLDEAISREDYPVSVSACVIPSGDLKAWATVDASKLIQFNGGYSFEPGEPDEPAALHNPASVTKLLTAIMVVENVEDLDMFVEMRAVDDVAGSGQELYETETFTYWELLHLMLMESNNEAATALARAVGEKFLSKGIIMT